MAIVSDSKKHVNQLWSIIDNNLYKPFKAFDMYVSVNTVRVKLLWSVKLLSMGLSRLQSSKEFITFISD